MKEKNKKEIKKDKKGNALINLKRLIIVIIALISTIYIIFAILWLNKDEAETIFVEQGTIHQEETIIGYIIRNEKVIQNEEYQNGIIHIADEGEKVYKNEAIFQYYSDEAKELSNQIVALDFQIQEKLKTENITANADIKLIETQIEDNLEKLKTLKNVQEITEYNKTVKNLFERKISTLGGINGASDELKQLIKQRNNIDNQIRNSTKYLTAPMSGIVSYRIDGLEEELNINEFSKYTTEYLEKLNLKSGKIIASSAQAGKVIDNFTYYIASSMKSEEAMSAKVGDKIKIRLSTNDEIQARIAQINEEDGRRVLILKLDRMIEKLINYRKISFDIIWSSDSGLKVPNKAIAKDKNGLSYLIRNRSGYLSKLIVKVVNSSENYSIISTYDSEELTNLGFTQEEISNYRKVKLYDEILMHPSEEKIK